MAGRGPRPDVRGGADLKRRLAERNPEPAYLLLGDDRRAIEEALEEFEALVDPGLAAMNSARLRGSETTAEEALGACATLPLMADRRLVVLREPERLGAGAEALAAYLKDPCPSTTLVLVPTEHDRRKKLSQAMEADACCVVFAAPGVDDLQGWVERVLEPRGVSIAPDALALLSDLVETDTLLLGNELEKLALYCCQSGRVEREDVEAILGRTRATEIWALTAAIEDGLPAEAALSLRRLLAEGAAVPQVVGTLDWCLGRLLGSEPPKAPPGRRRALDQRRRALHGRGRVVYDLLRAADRAVRQTGASPEAWLERG